jgi:hypothetical protein
MSDTESMEDEEDEFVEERRNFTNKAQYVKSKFDRVIGADGKRACLVDNCGKRLLDGKTASFEYHLTSKAHIGNKQLQLELQQWIDSTKQERKAKDGASIQAAPILPSKRRSEAMGKPMESITHHYSKVDPPLKEELSEATALCFAMHDWPISWTESPYVKQLLVSFAKAYNARLVTQLDGRVKIGEQQQLLADKIDNDVVTRMRISTSPVVLCHDGWRNINGMHVINLLAHTSSGTFLVASHVCESGRQTAEVIFAFLQREIDSLIEKGVTVAALVADNASVNGAVNRLIEQNYRWMLPLPCASHTLQLCILRMFDEDMVAERLRATCKRIYSTIANSGPLLAEFLRVQSGKPKHLHKPQRTRWSSFRLSFESILHCENAVTFVLASSLATPAARQLGSELDQAFWDQLKMMTEFLRAFSIASDIIQSDHAGLLDVHMQFQSLTQHVKRAPRALSHAASIMRRAMSHHWNTHVDQQAVFMAAKFSCEERLEQSELFSDRIKISAPKWFFQWAAELCKHNHGQKSLAADPLDATEVANQIEAQYDLFVADAFPYHDVRATIIAARPVSTNADQLFAPFNVLPMWRRLLDIKQIRDFAYAIISLLSLNCSEASVERSFSQQKLTHSLLTNRKAPATVSRQLKIKWNERELAKRDQRMMHAMRSVREYSEQKVDESEPNADEHEDEEEENDADLNLEQSSDDESSESETEAVPSSQAGSGRGRGRESRAGSQVGAVRVVAEQRSRHGWTTVHRITAELDCFCKQYIASNALSWPRPFRRGGAKRLREVFESDPSMSREQFTDVQAHLISLLMQQHRQPVDNDSVDERLNDEESA